MDFVGDDGYNKYFKYENELCVGDDSNIHGNALVNDLKKKYKIKMVTFLDCQRYIFLKNLDIILL